MKFIILLGIIGGVMFVVAKIIEGIKKASKKNPPSKTVIEKPRYHYNPKKFLLTKAENEFLKILTEVVGDRYFIFAQVRLSAIVDNKVKGQYWNAALSHINQKSVDFVLCDKEYISPLLAIELDDKSHERPDRRVRDIEVERILVDSGLPLLRFENSFNFDKEDIKQKIEKQFLAGIFNKVIK